MGLRSGGVGFAGGAVSKSSRSPKRKTAGRKVDPDSRRKVVVASSLFGVLALTSALLLALEPGQLRPEKPGLLAAVEPALETNVPVSLGRWRYIYIHQSGAPSGNATTLSAGPEGLGDHFVIGNGEGSIDGKIEVGHRWSDQLAPLPPAGANSIDPNCISVCLVGDFHQSLPTPTQMQKLAQLVTTLQAKYHISSQNVLMVNEQGGNRAVEIGRYFPVSAFRSQLLK
jgi:hypothetical protein